MARATAPLAPRSSGWRDICSTMPPGIITMDRKEPRRRLAGRLVAVPRLRGGAPGEDPQKKAARRNGMRRRGGTSGPSYTPRTWLLADRRIEPGSGRTGRSKAGPDFTVTVPGGGTTSRGWGAGRGAGPPGAGRERRGGSCVSCRRAPRRGGPRGPRATAPRGAPPRRGPTAPRRAGRQGGAWFSWRGGVGGRGGLLAGGRLMRVGARSGRGARGRRGGAGGALGGARRGAPGRGGAGERAGPPCRRAGWGGGAGPRVGPSPGSDPIPERT